MIFMGIDPGKSGAIAVIGQTVVDFVRLDSTESDIAEFIQSWDVLYDGECFAFLEKVSAMPKQGVSSTFKFGQSYGFCRGLLIAHKIPFETVTPQKWQRKLGCLSRGDKNVTKAKAQELFPNEKIVHATADALLIAEYCRRTRSELIGQT